MTSSQTGGAQSFDNALRHFRGRLADPGESPTQLTVDMSAYAGQEVSVADYPAPFELRKLQWRFSRSPAGGISEDVLVMTFHFIKGTGGAQGTWNDPVDLAAVETAAGTFWNAHRTVYPTWFHSDQFRWYKDGPAFYTLDDGTGHSPPRPPQYVPIPGNAAIRVTEVDVPGSSAVNQCLPPQIALSVTEKTSSRPHWGRFYMPIADATKFDVNGRFNTSFIDSFATTVVNFYNQCRSAGVQPVIFSIQKPERKTASGGTLPAAPAVAYEVSSIQIDDIGDIIRSRRWSGPTYRKVTALT